MQHNTQIHNNSRVNYEISNDGTYVSDLGVDFGYCKKCGKKLLHSEYEFCLDKGSFSDSCRAEYFRERNKDINGMGD